MQTFKARDIAAMSEDALWNLPAGKMLVEFDDGVLETTQRPTIFSAAMWGLYKRYPKTPALMRHHIGNSVVGSSTHLDYLNRVLWDCFDAYNGKLDIDSLAEQTYEHVNHIYNMFTRRLDAEVTTISILDFIDVMEHPTVKEANDTVRPTKASIDHTHRVITDVLLKDETFNRNALAEAARNKLVSLDQILQCIGPRGFVTDIDSNIFRKPILVGSVHGYRSLHDSLIESRSASKALGFTEEPLEYTEFFNRRLQLLAQVVREVYQGDCKSKNHLEVLISTTVDLRDFSGKYYLNEGKYIAIREHDKHLIGKVLKIRSVFHCQSKDTQRVCSICYGQLSHSIPHGTNIGHVAATALGEKITQRVLSLKHQEKSSSTGGIVLSDYDQRFVQVGSEPNELKLHPRFAGKSVRLVVAQEDAGHLNDIRKVKEIQSLNKSFISQIRAVVFVEETPDGEEASVVQVSMGNRLSMFTFEFLEYIAQKDYSMASDGSYIIDLSGWDVDLPLFELPMRHSNMLDYAKTIDSFIKSSDSKKQKVKSLKDYTTVGTALAAFHELVSTEIMVNIVHLEVILRSCMVRSIEHRDYRLPLPGNQVLFGSFGALMSRRSLGTLLVFQDQKRVLYSPSTFTVEKRPNSTMDQLFGQFTKQTV